MKMLLLALVTFVVALLPSHAAEKKAPAEPEYPGQPSINGALKHLTKAQEAISTNPKEAIGILKKAQISLEAAVKDKGTYRVTAVRQTKEAIRHLEKGDTATAARDVEEAIENTHKAGKQGSR